NDLQRPALEDISLAILGRLHHRLIDGAHRRTLEREPAIDDVEPPERFIAHAIEGRLDHPARRIKRTGWPGDDRNAARSLAGVSTLACPHRVAANIAFGARLCSRRRRRL